MTCPGLPLDAWALVRPVWILLLVHLKGFVHSSIFGVIARNGIGYAPHSGVYRLTLRE